MLASSRTSTKARAPRFVPSAKSTSLHHRKHVQMCVRCTVADPLVVDVDDATFAFTADFADCSRDVKNADGVVRGSPPHSATGGPLGGRQQGTVTATEHGAPSLAGCRTTALAPVVINASPRGVQCMRSLACSSRQRARDDVGESSPPKASMRSDSRRSARPTCAAGLA